jgi:hypothetical protein
MLGRSRGVPATGIGGGAVSTRDRRDRAWPAQFLLGNRAGPLEDMPEFLCSEIETSLRARVMPSLRILSKLPSRSFPGASVFGTTVEAQQTLAEQDWFRRSKGEEWVTPAMADEIVI